MSREKRFTVTVELDSGAVVQAHCANTGRMLDISDPGQRVWVYAYPDLGVRKLGYSLKMVEQGGTFIGTDTSVPMKLVREAFEATQSGGHSDNVMKDLFQGYHSLRAEVPFGESRLDFLLEGPKGKAYVEIKNVHLKRGKAALFPDTVTQRGARHLRDLSKAAEEGFRAIMVYIIQRHDCEEFRVAGHIDPQYALAFQQAKGVEFFAYGCSCAPDGITLEYRVPVKDPCYDR